MASGKMHPWELGESDLLQQLLESFAADPLHGLPEMPPVPPEPAAAVGQKRGRNGVSDEDEYEEAEVSRSQALPHFLERASCRVLATSGALHPHLPGV